MIITVKKRNIILMLAALVVLTALCLALPQNAAALAMGQNARSLPIYGVAREEKQIALSFDAAWGAEKTPKILEILKKEDIKATFFLVGFWVEEYPDTVKTIADAGMEIGNHSANHLKMSTLSEAEIEAELSSVNRKVNELTGQTPIVFRPPFGDYNDRLVDKTRAMGMYSVQWSCDSLDWKNLSGKEITDRVVGGATSGGIVLFHNDGKYTLDALPTIILKLKNEGYSFVTVGEQIYKENYYIDHKGTQHKN